MAGSDIHIRIDGIPGESTDARHRDEIVVDSWTWAVSNPAPPGGGGGGGGGAGRATFADLVFMHRADRASPELWKACATGRRLKEAVLSIARSGGGAQDYITIRLRDVRVTSVSLADAASDASPPAESVSLAYGRVEYDYRPQRPNGSLGAAVKFGFDLVANRVI